MVAWLGRNFRGILFGMLGLFLVLFLFDGPYWLVALLAPWEKPETVLGWLGLSHVQLASGGRYPPGFDPTNSWRLAQRAALGILLGGSMVALLWRPRTRPLLVLYFAAGILLIALSFGLSQGRVTMFSLVFAVMIPGILGALYPGFPDRLVSVAREARASFPLLAFSLLAAIAFAFDLWQNRQRLSGDSGMDLVLVLAGALAATRAPGWRALGIIAGLAFGYIGLAAMALPSTGGSWGVVGGSLSVLAGLAMIALTLHQSRKSRSVAQPTAIAPMAAS